MKKPGYSLTRHAFIVSFWLSWAVVAVMLIAGIFGTEAQREAVQALAPTFVPSMVLMVAGLLGIHRAFGSVDMRTAAVAKAPEGEGE